MKKSEKLNGYKWQSMAGAYDSPEAELRKLMKVSGSGYKHYDTIASVHPAFGMRATYSLRLSHAGGPFRNTITFIGENAYTEAKAFAEWLLPAVLEVRALQRAQEEAKRVERNLKMAEEVRAKEERVSVRPQALELLAKLGLKPVYEQDSFIVLDPREVVRLLGGKP